MHKCRDVVARMPRYVDASLRPEERAEIDRHLEKCRPCREKATHEAAGRTVLRHCAGHFKQVEVPEQLRMRCRAAARAAAGTPRRERGPGLPLFLTLGAAAVAGAAAFVIATRRSSRVLAAQLALDHLRCFLTVPPDAPTVTTAEATAQVAATVGPEVQIPPESVAEALRLIGVRRCLYGNGSLAHLLYQLRGEDLSLFILPGTHPAGDVTTLGHRAQIWAGDRATFVAVGSAESPEFTRAAAVLRQHAR
jgi:anti-sigma factor RsiW